MAIVIPSKNIYSINFNPVIDNQIDKVETRVNQIIPDNQYNVPVYNEKKAIVNPRTDVTITEKYEYLSYKYGSTAMPYINYVNYASYNNAKYINLTISIPIKQNKRFITSIIRGENSNGAPNIGCQLYGDVISGDVVGNMDIALSNEDNGWYSLTITNKNLEETNLIIKQDQAYTIPTKVVVDHFGYVNINNKTVPRVELNIDTEDNIKSAWYEKDEESYTFKFIILCGLKIYEIGAYSTNPNYVTLSGSKFTEYAPKELEITINGSYIGISLEEISKKIAIGNNVFSFDGNELIQTTNTPSIESKYQGIVNEWGNGKQTAVISCAVADYYNENAQLTERIVTKRQFDIVTMPQYALTYTGEVSVANLEGDVTSVTAALPTSLQLLFRVDVISFDNDKIMYQITARSPVQSDKTINVSFSIRMRTPPDRPLISVDGGGIPMVFNNGDIVVPYVFTNQGDKPLSYGKDFTPKQFEVVGVHITDEQGNTQELTLLEV